MSYDTQVVTTLRLAFSPAALEILATAIAKAATAAYKFDLDDCLCLVIQASGDPDEEVHSSITVESLYQGKVIAEFDSYTD